MTQTEVATICLVLDEVIRPLLNNDNKIVLTKKVCIGTNKVLSDSGSTWVVEYDPDENYFIPKLSKP